MEEHHAKGLESKVGDDELPKGIGKDRSHSTEHQTGPKISHRRVRIVSASEIATKLIFNKALAALDKQNLTTYNLIAMIHLNRMI